MLKVKILSVGKTKESWLEAAIDEYLKRLKPILSIEFTWAKDDTQLTSLTQKEPNALCLDPNGQLLTSERFSHLLFHELEKGGSRLALVIGGPDGLPSALKIHYPLISLSPLTFTHQITRLILVEQIYRSTEISKGSNYHRGSGSGKG